MPMDSDYMSEGEEPAMDKPTAKKDEMSEDEGGDSALLPKSLMAGKDFKPGDEIMLEVVKVYGDEFEVKYAKEKKEPKSGMDESMSEMDAMPMTSPGKY